MTELNERNFDAEISADVPVVVDFWAPWCGPCRNQAPILAQFAEQYAGKVKACKVNVDENETLARRFGIMSIPTILVFRGGELADKAVGVQSVSNLAALAGIR